ncbi:hypothetical protein GUITHDRAFT_114288 [Guillardia theta CCMP2712]|uniref:RWP-RK domain-containing protein n=1 Tax=Guillardia theta (strain CCMP2712) TaxID=905079 RepID=L1IUN9_GUITC|nr:hypothetical protein GUITHDRAFT_114288 [Guillardia theta CCMP2712]EKX39560.1 hypothetical protein GUITHDRAFT_114288 [Guillardia theta CCMP2712]|eukprot:XP_005826540.1 hypothetical protein GUITHDRAFT_114288 [Guillardia theta CCMP2712]
MSLPTAAVSITVRRPQGPSARLLRVSFSFHQVSSLFHLRQEEATASLVAPPAPLLLLLAWLLTLTQGISLTTLKQVSRRLGIRRWPYTRKGYEVHADAVGSLEARGRATLEGGERDQPHQQQQKEDAQAAKSPHMHESLIDEAGLETDEQDREEEDEEAAARAMQSWHDESYRDSSDSQLSCCDSVRVSEAWLAWYMASRSEEEDQVDVIWPGHELQERLSGIGRCWTLRK